MLVLAIDTATPAVTAGVVELTADAVVLRCRARGARRPQARRAADARRCRRSAPTPASTLRDIDAVVVGVGPGPFTGLRVGMVTAAALGDALGVPVHGVCSLDAIAADARRARGRCSSSPTPGAARCTGPPTTPPARASTGPHVRGAGRASPSGARAGRRGRGRCGSAGLVGLPVRPPESPSPTGLVAVAAPALRAGAAPDPLVPLYLRRPDAVEPGTRKRVSA